MGWQTDLFCNITFNRETFNHKVSVENRIEELEMSLQCSKARLRDLVMMTEPNKFCPEDYDSIIWIRNEYEDTMNLIEEDTIELYKLNLLLDNWDHCHNEQGLAIDPPEGISWDTAFLDGDFVRSIKNPNSHE